MPTFFDFNSVMQQWTQIGLFDIILPVILIFTLVYAVLMRTTILGKNKSINAVTAVTIAFFAISNPDVSRIMLVLFPSAAVGISIILVFLLIVGLIMPRPYGIWKHLSVWGGIVIFIWVMSRASNYFGGDFIFSSFWWANNSWWLMPIIMFALIIGFITYSETPLEGRARAFREYNPLTWEQLVSGGKGAEFPNTFFDEPPPAQPSG